MPALLTRSMAGLAQSRIDAERFSSLGSRNVMVTGNLKLDVPAPPADFAKLERLMAVTRGRPIIVAASTHPGEEEVLLEAHRTLAGFFPSLLTVIGMFLIAFLTFIGTAMIYGTLPAAPAGDASPERFLGWQRTIYVMANCGYFVGLSLSWFALRPFLIAIKLDDGFGDFDFLQGAVPFRWETAPEGGPRKDAAAIPSGRFRCKEAGGAGSKLVRQAATAVRSSRRRLRRRPDR